MTDWPSKVAKLDAVRQRLRSIDRLYSYPPAGRPAFESQLVAVEDLVGGRLDKNYREFLRVANGWKNFFQELHLFGTGQLLGDSLMRTAVQQITAVDSVVENLTGFELGKVVPIGASEMQNDMLLLGAPGSAKEGNVLWFWGDGFESYPSFRDLFLAVIDLSERELRRFENA